jgi:hypothetical protein
MDRHIPLEEESNDWNWIHLFTTTFDDEGENG